jgi:DNA mismatch endonuclease (patch repair protein)
MSRVRQRDTSAEIAVRSALHRLGYRFRLHRRDLPGSPDIVMPRHRTVIFVHGCFWHRHAGCRRTTSPKTNTAFWLAKFAANVERDARKGAELEALGWRVIVIWECETKDAGRLEVAIRNAFASAALAGKINVDTEPSR